MDQQALFSIALGLELPWYIASVELQENKELVIKVDFKTGSKFFYEDKEGGICGTFPAYDTEIKRWRHLNFFQYPCYLEARVPRVDTGNGKMRLVKTPWEGKSKGFTLLFEAFLLQFSKSLTVHAIAKLCETYDGKIWELLYAYVGGAEEQMDLSAVRQIGIDETACRRGHDYVTTVVDLEAGKTIFVAGGRDHKTLEAFAGQLKEKKGDPEAIEQISCDMSPAFIKGIEENFAQAEIVFDKFHLVQVVNKAVDEVRKQEAKTNPILKGSKYVFLKNRDNLSEGQAEKLEEIRLSRLNLKTMRALQIRESFQQIYSAATAEDFEGLLKKWCSWATRSRIEPIKQAAATIKRHWAGVVSWFDHKISNAMLEGFNSLFQAAKARARGYKAFKTIKTVILIHTGKLNFSTLNPHCSTHPFL